MAHTKKNKLKIIKKKQKKKLGMQAENKLRIPMKTKLIRLYGYTQHTKKKEC